MTVTLPTWALALVVAVSGAAGYVSCYFGVVKIGTAAMRARRLSNREATTMPHRRTPWVPIIMLVAAAMVVSIGVMSWLDSRHQAEQEREREQDRAAQVAAQIDYDACITEWGDELVSGINDAKAARRAYDTATSARADATAEVLRTALSLILNPPRATARDLRTALEAARRADRRVVATRATLDASAPDEYEPPTLACASERTNPK